VRRPRIGITIGYDGSRDGVFQLRQDYVRSVEQAQALPLVLAPGRAEDASALLDTLDGLMLSGGADVDPALYGESSHAKVTRVIAERDAFEIALCRAALERDLPVLAICRGQQMLNVAGGGTLVQDIPSQLPDALDHDPEQERWRPAHDVTVEAGSRLRAILGCERTAVNSFHHQAVKDLGRELVVSARCPDDGVVEGIEAPTRRFVVGVQWHPESFWREPQRFGSLFRAFVEAAR
jgi:putative glutamine amidotransferase